ncbi:hypothetical protein [Burkholderia stagnalis]|uniref:hypothetical protein n=1 Tax=Burkholderia stagnalis TaxID=1503054 RepID=UPI000B2C1B73|nr:hypothetical protein [Burkholderia stagnalis]
MSADGGLEATASRAFESHRQQKKRMHPIRGTTVLCAADKDSQAKAPRTQVFTAFSGILIDVLLNGKINGPSLFSLRDIVNIACTRIKEMEDVPMPVLLSPDQTEGDLADLDMFPNQAATVKIHYTNPPIETSRPPIVKKTRKISILITVLTTIVLVLVVKIAAWIDGSFGEHTDIVPAYPSGTGAEGAAGTSSASLPNTAGAADKAVADKLAADKPAADKPAADKPAADKLAADKAAAYARIYDDYAKCHNTADQDACSRVPLNWEPH